MTVASNSNRVTLVKDKIKARIDSSFASTLGRESDIVNVISALIHFESRFNTNALGDIVFPDQYSKNGTYLFKNSPAIVSFLSNPSTTYPQRANIDKGLRAVGVMQVMGHYFIKGAAPSGKTELERSRPDLATPLLVNPGDDIFTNILGEANLDKAITSGLIILESKYKAVSFGSGYYYFTADKYGRKFSSRLQAAVGAYLGLGKADGNNTTLEKYALSIMGGSSYKIANGKDSLKIRDSEVVVASSNGPSTNGSDLGKIIPPGC
jgi:hypothetical protein